ncbi:MAG TPA: cytochrome B [Chryseosolibacter sp.]
MYTGLLHTHSFLRYFVLILLVVVIVQSLMGWLGRKPYGSLDNRLGLFLFIFTHTQLLVGLILYFVSPFVQFSGAAMKEASTRYWLVEHSLMMLIAIVLITMARVTSKKMENSEAKHKRMFIFNTIALVIIVVAIVMSGRGLITRP